MKDITNLAWFAHVVEHGSFSAAARTLRVPKSTLSRRIADLEEELGVRLLNRTTRKLYLTDVGREFLVHCQTVVAAAEAAEQVTHFVQEKPRGKVRISSPYAISQSLLVSIMPGFLKRYPDVQIDLVMTNKPVNLIEEQVDIALRVRPTIEDSSLIARDLVPSASALFTSPEFLQTHGVPEHPLDLSDWPSLSMHYSSGRYQWSFTAQHGESITMNYQPRLITDDLWVLREAAAEHQGVVSLPVYLCREYIDQGRLVRVLPSWRLPVGKLHMVYPYRRGLLPAVRVLIDYLVECMPSAAGVAGLATDSDA
ncbi:LysR substrate-binding domain-containing protein [Aliidiomarina indica]|uniref:LysR substrate-binding domain-containing protein n=1 Tax=Aliidiomarina indica TaxID=2749147 RepID=UPI00188E97AE|nr:LysR substrate-binding domain-containing protein [Aliidiomarina indica]